MIKKRYKIDWLTVTDKFHDVSQVCNLWFQLFGEPVSMPGRYGYYDRFTAEGVSVLYNGGNRGVCTDINGTGTNILYGQNFILEDYLRSVVCLEPYYNITRLDVAMDYFADSEDDRFPFDKLIQALKECRFVSKVHKNQKSVTFTEGLNPNNMYRDPVMTVTIGSKSSDIKLRIYNKLAEQKSKKCGYIPTDIFDDGKEPLQWLRFEFELRSERAEQFAALLRKDTLEHNFDGLLSKFIRFVDELDVANPQRSPVCDWWESFVSCFVTFLLCEHQSEPVVTEEKLKTYVTQTRNAAYTYAQVFGWEALLDLICDGEYGLPPKYQLLISGYRHRHKCDKEKLLRSVS